MIMRYFTFVLSFFIVSSLVLLGAGCGEKAQEQKETKTVKETVQEVFGSIGDAIASGKSVKCTVSYTGGSEDMENIYWIKGDNMRGETSIGGQERVFIKKDNVFYTMADFNESNCDWISTDMSEADGSEESESVEDDFSDFDYKQYDNNSMFRVQCERESFGDDKFEVEGEVCTMEEIFSGMMNGFDFEPE